MQHVVQNVERVHADQHRLRRRDVALHQSDMLGILDLVDVDHHAELAAVLAVQHGFQRALDDRLGPAAIGDQVGDGADLQPVELGELHQIRQPGHGAVVVHDLADHAGRVHPRHARQIDRRFRVSRPDQHAAVAGDQREDVAGGRDVVGAHGRVDRDLDGAGAVGGGDAGGDTLARFDRHGEGGLVARRVLLGHQRQPKLLDPLAGHGEADQAAAEARHEIDRFGCGALGRNDQIALVLPVLVVDQDEHAALAGLLKDFLDGREIGLIGRIA